MTAMPFEHEIVRNSRLDTLYSHAFKVGEEGEGRFFNVVTLEDGSQQVDVNLHSRIRITLVFIKKRNDIDSVQITKFRYNKRLGWRPDQEESIKLSPVTLAKLIAIMRCLAELDLAGIHHRRIRLADDALPDIDTETKKKIRTLLSKREGPALIEELLKSEIVSTKDLVNVGYRKAQLQLFRKLLDEPAYMEIYKAQIGVIQKGSEPGWQGFFERNAWIFGYGLTYIWCNNLPDSKLEQVVSGADFGAYGKRTDALLRTSAAISQFVLVEIKTPDTPLMTNSPRPGVWSPSGKLMDAVAQIQNTVSRFKQRYYEKAELKTDAGDPIGTDVYNVSPKSFLLIGDLNEFRSTSGVNVEKFSSFQLLRSGLRDPEVLTFDELYARAAAILETAEGR